MIRNLDPNKAHGYHMIGIRMIKICDASICRPPKLIFQSCLESGKFPIEWKKRMWFQFTSGKTILKYYQPISLLPIAGKIFEWLFYARMLEFVIENNLISKNQLGFSDSCINQLLFITHEIYQSFDDRY